MNVPSYLKTAEFALVQIQLEFQQACLLPRGFELRLRRELRQVGSYVLPPDRFARLLEPPLPSDPVALRHYQRPAPPFALRPQMLPDTALEEGDEYTLSVVLFGDGIQCLDDFLLLLQALGRVGLWRGEGMFEPVTACSLTPQGNRQRFWQRGQRAVSPAPTINELSWWLEGLPAGGTYRLTFISPARLVSAGRPLFRCDFKQLLPFLLRRISSLLYSSCGIELGGAEIATLLGAAAQVQVVGNHLCWEDWRILEGEVGALELGGLMGDIQLAGSALADLLWLLQLGSLCNLGKSAAYGGGSYQIERLAD